MTGQHGPEPSGGPPEHASPRIPGTQHRHRGRPAAGRWRALVGSAPAAVVAFGLLTFACTLVAVAGPRAGVQLQTNVVQQLVAQLPAQGRAIIGSTDDNSISRGLTPGIDAAQIQASQRLLAAHLRGSFPLGPAGSTWAGLSTQVEPVGDDYRAGLGSYGADLALDYRSTLSREVKVVAGALPGGLPTAGATATVQVAVTPATARRFGLGIGSLVPMPGNHLVLKVSGIVQPVDPAAPFWTVDPLAATPQLIAPEQGSSFWQGEAFIAGSAVLALQTRFEQTSMQVSFMFPVDLTNLTTARAAAVEHNLTTGLWAAGSITTDGGQIPEQVSLVSGLTTVLQNFITTSMAAGGVLSLLSVSLAVVGAAVVLLAAWLLADRRREEFAVLRARGASRRQLAGRAMSGSAIAAVPAVVAGAAVAVAFTPTATAPLGWWLAGLILAVAVGGMAIITVASHARPAGASVRPDAPGPGISSARRLVAEGGLVLAAVGGLIVLRDQGLGPGSSDVYASAAPVLLAIPVAIVMLRIYPLAVRGLLRAFGGRAGPTTFLGLARAARVPAGAVLPAFAMVLALALVSFTGMVRGAVVRGEVAASWQLAGADAVIAGQQPVTGSQIRAIAAVHGVSRLLPVAIVPGADRTGQFNVMIARPGQYGGYLAATPLPGGPASVSSGQAPGGVVPVLASPALAAKLGDKPVVVSVGTAQVRVQVAGLAASMSAVASIGAGGSDGYLVLPSTAYHAAAPATAVLVLGPSLDQAALTRLARRDLPHAAIVFRSRLLAGLETAPLQHGTYLALALGGAAAAAAALLVLLLTLLMSAGSRQLTLARMSTMGLSAGQARRLTLIEALPQLVAVLAGGLGCALVLAPTVGPALSLSLFTGSAATVPVLIEPLWLVGTGAGLLVLALAVLAAQTALAGRAIPQSVRMGG